MLKGLRGLGRYYPLWLELVPLLLLVLAWIYPATYYAELPARVPTHFGGGGAPDAWSQKGFFSVYFGPLVMSGLYLLLEGITLWLAGPEGAAGVFSSPWINPHFTPKEMEAIGPQRLEGLRAFMVRILWLTSALLTGLSAWVSYSFVNVALGRQEGLNWPFWLLVAAILAVSVWSAVRVGVLTKSARGE